MSRSYTCLEQPFVTKKNRILQPRDLLSSPSATEDSSFCPLVPGGAVFRIYFLTFHPKHTPLGSIGSLGCSLYDLFSYFPSQAHSTWIHWFPGVQSLGSIFLLSPQAHSTWIHWFPGVQSLGSIFLLSIPSALHLDPLVPGGAVFRIYFLTFTPSTLHLDPLNHF